MATEYCNFSEKTLDAWLRDRGGKNTVPGLTLRLRLRREGSKPTMKDPRLAFYLVRKIKGRKRSLLIGERATYTVTMARVKAKDELQKLSQRIEDTLLGSAGLPSLPEHGQATPGPSSGSSRGLDEVVCCFQQ